MRMEFRKRQKMTKRDNERDTVMDLGAKAVFRNRRLLAELFGYLTQEFSGMDPDDIEKCIVTETDGTPIDFNTELSDPNTGSVRLDTIAEAIVPGGNDRVRIRFNLEMQARTDTEYRLTDRAQMYAAMMLATQNKESVGGEKYQYLKRCYSVWVCPKPSRELDGKVFAYSMQPQFGDTVCPEFGSLLDIVMVYPGRSEDRKEKSVTDMLSLVFSKGLDTGRCQKILDAKYKIDIDLSSLERVKMTDWYGEGKADGIKEGKAAGRLEKAAEDIIILMDRYGENLDNALDIMKVPEQDREDVKLLVEELQKTS